jgi:hypothetical protein
MVLTGFELEVVGCKKELLEATRGLGFEGSLGPCSLAYFRPHPSKPITMSTKK